MEVPINDDSSHYEISLTAGQAFIAFVLLLFSLAAAFAFGVIIGRGQADERLVVQREPAVITESAAAAGGNIVELGVPKSSTTAITDTVTDTTMSAQASTIIDEASPGTTAIVSMTTPIGDVHTEAPAAAHEPAPVATLAPRPATPTAKTAAEPYYAQLLSSSEAKTAENLAAKLIDNGFSTAYVQRSLTDKGTSYRVRVKFSSENEARAAVDRLKPFAKGEIWITKQ